MLLCAATASECTSYTFVLEFAIGPTEDKQVNTRVAGGVAAKTFKPFPGCASASRLPWTFSELSTPCCDAFSVFGAVKADEPTVSKRQLFPTVVSPTRWMEEYQL